MKTYYIYDCNTTAEKIFTDSIAWFKAIMEIMDYMTIAEIRRDWIETLERGYDAMAYHRISTNIKIEVGMEIIRV